jgi:hypothetical protein
MLMMSVMCDADCVLSLSSSSSKLSSNGPNEFEIAISFPDSNEWRLKSTLLPLPSAADHDACNIEDIEWKGC